MTSEEEEEENSRKQLTPGELITMHKDGRCTAKPVVQVMSTVVTDGKLVSMTLSDGEYVSANIIAEDESLGSSPWKSLTSSKFMKPPCTRAI